MKSASATVERGATAPRVGARAWRWVLELLGLVGLTVLALAPRLVGLDQDTDASDEGIRGLQLRLMAAGFKPVSEIYASQGPLSLPVFYPWYVLFGGDIVAARLAVVVYAVCAVGAVYWLDRRLDGPIAGLAAAAMLAASPVFLENSRLAFVEVPSLAPALLAVAALVGYRATGRRAWLVLSAVLLAVGALAKPMAALVGGTAAVLVLVPRSDGRGWLGAGRADGWRRAVADLGLYAVVGLAVVAAVITLVGFSQVYEQLVGYRLGARAARGWDLPANWGLVRGELGREGLGFLLASLVGALLLIRRRPFEAAALLVWLVGGVALLLVYSPLWPKHVVYLLPPLALLAGSAWSAGARALLDLAHRRRADLARLASLLAVGAYLLWLPAVVERDRRLLERSIAADAGPYSDDLRLVAALTAPSDFIVMDDAYLALTTGRLVPPYLADLSWNRILARALTAERAIAETARFGARVLVVQDDHLGQLPRYLSWADRNYRLVKAYVQKRPTRFRRVYAARDLDLAAARAALGGGIQTPLRAELGPAALLGYSLDRREVKTGTRFALTLHWEALQSSPPEHHLLVRLRAADGRIADESVWRIGEGEQELPTWSAGQWQFQMLRVQVADDVPIGAYTLTLALDRPGGGLAAVRSDGVAPSAASGTELELGELRVH